MLISVIAVPFSAASEEAAADTSASTISDEEMAKLIEESKIDKGNKLDNNIFTIEIVGLEAINKRILEAKDPAAEAKAVNEEGFSVKFTVDNDELTKGETVTGYSISVSDRSGGSYKSMADSSKEYTSEKLSPNTVYLITADVTVKTENGEELRTFVGTFGIGANEDYTPYCEMTALDVTDLKNAYNTIEISEKKEMNGSSLLFEKTSGNNRYYILNPDSDGLLNVTLYYEAKKGNGLDLIVRKYVEGQEMADMPEYTSSRASSGDYETVRFYADEGVQYVAEIVNNTNNETAYTIQTLSFTTPHWFPQWMSTSADGTTYWDGTHLNNAFHKNSFTNNNDLPIFINYEQGADPSFILKSACFVSCYAMSIANIGNTTSNYYYYDIRDMSSISYNNYNTLYTHQLHADPYTVFLMRNSFNGKHYSLINNNTQLRSTSLHYTNVSSYSNICNEFNVTKNNSTNISVTLAGAAGYNQLYQQTYSTVINNPEGVMLSYVNANGSGHCILIAYVGGSFRVFDPGRNGNSTISNYNDVLMYTYFVTNNVRDITLFNTCTVLTGN